MKILHAVQFYQPQVGGMEEVVKQLSQRLVKLGHEVTILTSYNAERSSCDLKGVKVKEFNISGNFATGLKGEVQQCEDYLLESNFDIVTLFAAQQWTCDIFFQNDLLSKISAKKVFVPTGFSGLYEKKYENYFEKMKDWFHCFDMSIFLSHDYRDINFAKDIGLKSLKLIPNGASEDEFSLSLPKKDSSKPLSILHVGNHTGQKGHRELMSMYRLSEVDETTLTIVGRKNWKGRCYLKCCFRAFLLNLLFTFKGQKKKIFLKSLTRDETIKEYYQADLFLFPSNIECSPIVLFESCASETPFLTGQAGNAEEIIKWTGAGELLPCDRDSNGRVQVKIPPSVKILDDLLRNPNKRKEMGQQGLLAWKKSFCWSEISKEYERTYSKLLEDLS